MGRLNNDATREYMRNYRLAKKGMAAAPKRPTALGPLSPAMRHLAKFDAIIANRLRQESIPAQKEEEAFPPPPKSSSPQDH